MKVWKEGIRQPLQKPAHERPALLRVCLALGLISAASILSEITLTRLFSVVLPYYFVYVLLSVAILGMGFGAFLGHSQRERLQGSGLYGLLPLVAAATGIALVLLFILTVSERWWLGYLFLSCALFASVGAFVSQTFSMFVQRSGWLYWADLTGAGIGALVALLSLTVLGSINTVLFAALLFGIGGILLHWSIRWFGAVGLLSVLLVLNVGLGFLDLDLQRAESTKTIATALDRDGLHGEVIFSDWDAFARTDLVSYPDLANERTLFVDGGSGSSVFRVEGGIESLAYLRNDLGYVPFRWLEPDTVFIIGPGGGKDIALALLGQAQSITAVEINPGIVRALDSISDYNGNLHRDPAVELHIGEGRSFLRSQSRTWDLIYLSLVANEAADMSSLALSENYVYTQEAFLDYLAHLEPGGAVALRLHGDAHMNRAFTTALAALGSRGLSTAEAMQQIIVLAGGVRPGSPSELDPLLLVLASPLSPDKASALLDMLQTVGILPLFIPHSWEEAPFAAFAQGQIQLDEFLSRAKASYASPTTDDRPFFFLLEEGLPRELAQLSWLLIAASVAWAIYLYSYRRRLKREQGPFAWWPYFAVLGLGFMLIEIALIQDYNLFLGHPTLSLGTVLGGLLISTGLGSLAARKREGLNARTLALRAALGISVLGVIYLIFLPRLLSALLGVPLGIRLLVALGTILPLGLLLGIPFPLGLRLLGARHAGAVALAWASNGLFAVSGSVLAMVVAIQWGFGFVWALGSVSYLLIAALLWKALNCMNKP